MKKLFKKIIHVLSLLIIDSNASSFIEHNKKMWKGWKLDNPDGVILVEFHDMYETLIASSYFLNILANKHNAAIKSFSRKKLYHHHLKHELYKSFNSTGHIATHLNAKQKRHRDSLMKDLIPSLKTKKDVYDLNVLGFWIGIDIYESYLRELYEPTVLINDPRLIEMIKRGIGVLIFWLDYFEKYNVKSLILSHDCYLHLNIPCKIAYSKNIPVYLPNCIGATYATEPFSVHSNFISYQKSFSKLSSEQQESARQLAKNQLDRRFKGEAGVDMSYSTESAFITFNPNERILNDNVRIKVLITSHCFFDNPNAYGGFLFLDFYEWLVFLGQVSEETDYDWYIKMHPNPLPGTLEIIEGIIKDFPKIKLIPSKTSHKQLISEGIDFVLTGYGTVGIEYPAFGKQVINAGYNPRSGYEFNWNPTSVEEYRNYLLNLKNLHLKIDIDKVYECYYMQYYYVYFDDLVFKSYRQLGIDLTPQERSGTGSMKYFLDQFDMEQHNKTIKAFEEFIVSGKRHLFSQGPEDS